MDHRIRRTMIDAYPRSMLTNGTCLRALMCVWLELPIFKCFVSRPGSRLGTQFERVRLHAYLIPKFKFDVRSSKQEPKFPVKSCFDLGLRKHRPFFLQFCTAGATMQTSSPTSCTRASPSRRAMHKCGEILFLQARIRRSVDRSLQVPYRSWPVVAFILPTPPWPPRLSLGTISQT